MRAGVSRNRMLEVIGVTNRIFGALVIGETSDPRANIIIILKRSLDIEPALIFGRFKDWMLVSVEVVERGRFVRTTAFVYSVILYIHVYTY